MQFTAQPEGSVGTVQGVRNANSRLAAGASSLAHVAQY